MGTSIRVVSERRCEGCGFGAGQVDLVTEETEEVIVT